MCNADSSAGVGPRGPWPDVRDTVPISPLAHLKRAPGSLLDRATRGPNPRALRNIWRPDTATARRAVHGGP